MHRGFKFYYREGLRESRKTIYRNKSFFKYILYYLAEFFGRALIVFNPHFNIANMRQGYFVRKANRADFSSAFGSNGHKVPIGTYILTLCFEGLILLAGAVATAAIAALLGGVGYGVAQIAAYENYELLVLLFAAPAAPILLLYVTVSLLIFSPTAYIIANNDGVSAGETIGACYKSMINNGKMTVFLSYFVSGLLKSLYLGAFACGGYFLFTVFIPQNYFALALTGWIILALSGYLAFAPILTLANRVVKEHLFEDIVLDPSTASRVSEKVNVSVCNGKKIDGAAVPQNLASLFEYTEDPYRILKQAEEKSARFKIEPSKPRKKKSEDKVEENLEPPRKAKAMEEPASAARSFIPPKPAATKIEETSVPPVGARS